MADETKKNHALSVLMSARVNLCLSIDAAKGEHEHLAQRIEGNEANILVMNARIEDLTEAITKLEGEQS